MVSLSPIVECKCSALRSESIGPVQDTATIFKKMYLIDLLHDVMFALERSSAELEDNNNAIRSLLQRIEGGEIALADAEAQRSHLIAVSDRLQQERLRLVSTAEDVRLRVADSSRSLEELARRGNARQPGLDSLRQSVKRLAN